MIDQAEQASPRVPPRSGARLLFWLFVISAVITSTIGVLALLSGGAYLLGRSVGVAVGDDVSAQVVKREFFGATYGWRGSGSCERVRFTVTWEDGGHGTFSVCTSRPLSQLRTGDQVEVHTLPVLTEVLPKGEPYKFWSLIGLLIGVPGTFGCLRAAWRYRALMKYGARGPWFDGVAVTAAGSTLVVTPTKEPHRQLVLLSANASQSVVAPDPVRVWASRTSRWRGRPRGPWVARSSRGLDVYTHAWWRRTK